MITFHKEDLLTIFPQIIGLLEEHYEELTMCKARVKLNPWLDEYMALEKKGSYIAMTVKDDGVVIGYSGFFFKPHLHYRDIAVATNDVLFLKKERRQGMTGVRFLNYCEKVVAQLGADKITYHLKDQVNFSRLLLRKKYFVEDTIYSKFLTEQSQEDIMTDYAALNTSEGYGTINPASL